MSNRMFVIVVALVFVALCVGMVGLAADPMLAWAEPGAEEYAEAQADLRQAGPVGEMAADSIAATIAGVFVSALGVAAWGYYKRVRGVR